MPLLNSQMIKIIILILFIICCINFIFIDHFKLVIISSSSPSSGDIINSSSIIKMTVNINENTEKDMMRPWDPFDFDVFDVINNFEIYNNYEIPENTDEHLSNEIEMIQNISNIDSSYKTCRNITSFGYELPIGIPSYNKTIWYNDSYISLKPNWRLCLIHSIDIFLAGMTMFNKYHYYSFYMEHLAGRNFKRCHKNKTTKPIINSLYFNHDKYHLNVVFLITGNACNAFQHFMINIPARWATMYQWLEYLIKITQNSKYFLNITIATNINWKKSKSIHVWFWNQFGFNEGINKIHDNINISVISVEGWCAKIDYNWYAPFVITPYFIDINANWNDYYSPSNTYHRRRMYAWNSLYHIKHLLTNINTKKDCIIYLNRGKVLRRGVTNNDQVIEYLNKSAINNGYKFIVYECCQDISSFDQAKAIFSRAQIVIGPHGGKFANLLFVQFGSYVIEFNNWFSNIHDDTSLRDRPFYYALALANGLHYYYISPKDFNYDNRMTIELTQLDTILKQIYHRINNNEQS